MIIYPKAQQATRGGIPYDAVWKPTPELSKHQSQPIRLKRDKLNAHSLHILFYGTIVNKRHRKLYLEWFE